MSIQWNIDYIGRQRECILRRLRILYSGISDTVLWNTYQQSLQTAQNSHELYGTIASILLPHILHRVGGMDETHETR